MVTLDPSLAIVPALLALASAVLWGISDFGGGLLGRRAPIFGVLLATQGIGFLTAITGMVVSAERPPAGVDLGLSALAGVLAALGVGSLYRGLAIGRMGVVAPVTAVLTATTPAIIGIAWQGFPGPIVFVGFGVAIVAVIIVSIVPDDASDRPAGLGYALVGGLTLGLLGVVLSRVDLQHAFSPLALIRAIELVLFAAIVGLGRLPWRMPRSSLPLVVLVGIVDVVGNLAFLTAARTGDLAIAAVLSSLYPVVTVILAASLLNERMTRSHAAGVALAFVAIVLITANAA
ncbi:MAG: EamA family transporter [Chloroflexota bacterium]|nr:MAG: EamA family transporter [Chloroflexota bacterium]